LTWDPRGGPPLGPGRQRIKDPARRPARLRPSAPCQATYTLEGGRPGNLTTAAATRRNCTHETGCARNSGCSTAAVRREPGCLELRSSKDAANPADFYLYEIYADTSAFRTHLTTDHVAHFFAELAQHSTADAQALVQLIELPAP